MSSSPSVATLLGLFVFIDLALPSVSLSLSLTLLHIGGRVGGLPERKQEEKEERGRIEEWKRLEGCREIVAEGRDRRGKAKRGRERDKTNNLAQMAKKK